VILVSRMDIRILVNLKDYFTSTIPDLLITPLSLKASMVKY